MGNIVILEVYKLQIQIFFLITQSQEKLPNGLRQLLPHLVNTKFIKSFAKLMNQTKKKITHIQKYKFIHI